MDKLNVSYKSFQISQWIAIAMPIVFFCSWFLKFYIERFRGSSDYRWIYEYGNLLHGLLVGFCFTYSIVNSLVIFVDVKGTWQKRTLWVLISSFVFLYVITMTIKIAISVS